MLGSVLATTGAGTLKSNRTALRDASEGGVGSGSVHAPTLQSASYVSSLLGERLASGRPLTEAETSRVQGALMLTDIEGWTSLVEDMCAVGPEGLDELGATQNAYFIQLADTVYGHGGDVLTGVGDAFLCCWLASGADDLAEATARAARAALAFQAAAEDHAGPGGRRLRTRIGIAAGELEMAMFGGVGGRWELFPMGDPLDEVAAAERSAPAGGVAAAASAWEHLAGIADGFALDEAGLVALTSPPPAVRQTGHHRRRDMELSDEVLRPFVPAPVRGWGAAGAGAEWLAELRRVTVVMVRLLDSGGGLARATERTQLAARTFQETIARFEGASKLGIDNKGLTLSGVFGLAPRAHEDDPERALRVAATLSEQFDGLGLPCSIGVATGPVFCGLFGNDLRREYTLSGDVMNLTARLAHTGDVEILCDEVTVGAVSDRYHFQALAPLAVRGRAEPVRIRSLQGIRAATPPRSTELVDRAAERATLAERLRLLTVDGERGAIVVEGDAGIGKSALAAEVARLAEQMGATVLTARADAVERATSYYAWRPVFAAVLGLDGEPASESALARLVTEQLGEEREARQLLPLLSSVLPIAISDSEFTAAMAGDVRADNTTQLLTRILSRFTASDPVLLLVEDAHWLDSNSWSLLREMVRVVPRLLTLITTRPIGADSDVEPDEYEELIALASREPMRLRRLAPDDTAALVRQRLGVGEVPGALTRFIEDRVAGHPYFCEALLKAMQESGIVQVRHGRAILGAFESLDVPATVQGAVLSLVDRLTPGQQLSLKVAAVVGRTFSVRAVAEVYPVSEERDSVPHDLRVLRRLDLIANVSSEAEPTYTFRHEITRDVAYGLLTGSQRRPLHQAVAEWYEAAHSTQELERLSARLAHHWTRADEPAKAIPYLEYAGKGALRSGAFREAAQFYAQLTAASDVTVRDPAQLALWEKGAATAHYFLGDFERSRMLLERALARLDREVPRGRVAVARGLMQVGAQQLAHLALPERYRGRRRAEKEVLDEAVDCYKILSQISYLDGESVGELVYLMFAGLNLGEQAGASPELARALANAAGVASLVNFRAPADRYVARAVRLAENEGQSEALAYVWNVYALIEAQRGDWRSGIAASDRALELFGEVGDYNLEAELWQTRSALHICRGDFSGAEGCWTRTRELAARNGNPQLECWSLLDEVQTQLGRGAIKPAADALAAALAIETAPSDGGTRIEKHCCTAGTRLQEGRSEEALRAADNVIEMVSSQTPTGFHWAGFAVDAVEVYLGLLEQASTAGERSALERRSERGLRALRRIAFAFHGIRPRRLLLAGWLDWERGRQDRAARAWRKAESNAAAMEMDYDLARARLEVVRHGLAGSERAALLEGPINTFERLGATRHLRIAESC